MTSTAPLPVLMHGTSGAVVAAWQAFLASQGFATGPGAVGAAAAVFDDVTDARTRDFQDRENLSRVDGVVGAETWQRAMALDPGLRARLPGTDAMPAHVPARVAGRHAPARLDARRRAEFCELPKAAPDADGTPRYVITEAWIAEHLRRIRIEPLRGIAGAPADGWLYCHRKVAADIRKLFQLWEKEGQLPLVLSFDSGFHVRAPRPDPTRPDPTRPDPTRPDPARAEAPTAPSLRVEIGVPVRAEALSPHALGIAFDINATWNLIGQSPAPLGAMGSVLELVDNAARCGFWWGGDDPARPEGCHFEFAGPPPKPGRKDAAPAAARRATPRRPARGKAPKA